MATNTDIHIRPRARQFDMALWFGHYGTIVSLILLILVFSALQPTVFPTVGNLLNIMEQISIQGTISVGLTICLIMGLYDLSIAAMVTVGGYLCPFLLTVAPIPVVLGIAMTLLVAAGIGAINGAIVSFMGISAFIATLAMGSILTGSVLGISGSKSIVSGIPDSFMIIGQGDIGGVPVAVIIMLLVVAFFWVVSEHTQFGRTLYAIGSNAEASRLSGIATKRYPPLALSICAVCSALGGVMASSTLGSGRPENIGDAYLLNAFASVFIGASTLTPGRFHIVGTVVGVLLIGIINNGLSILGVATFWQYIVQGLLLIFALFSAGILKLRKS
jgi:ribose transport system permease protein